MHFILENLSELNNISGRKNKADRFKVFLQNEHFRYFVKMTLDTSFHYNVLPFIEFKENELNYTLNDVFNKLEEISNKRGCTSNDIDELYNIACSSIDLFKLTNIILSHSLNCGCGPKMVNDIIPNYIEIFPYMQCSDKTKLKKIIFPVYAQQKMDGGFLCIINDNDNIIYRSRNGNYLNLYNIFDDFFKIPELKNMVCMGEIIVKLSDNTYLNRAESNGILNKAIQGTISKDEVSTMEIVLWDIVNKDQFFNSNIFISDGYEVRFNKLQNIINNNKYNNIKLIENKILSSIDDVFEYYNTVIENGGEGLVIKDVNNIFKDGRSNTMIKMKEVKDMDLKIVGWEYGKLGSKFENCLGSIILESQNGDLIVNCGVGFSEKMRGYLGKNSVCMDNEIKTYWDSLVLNGSTIEVEYNSVINSATDDSKKTLYLPVFKSVRDDKTYPDTIERIF